MRIHILLKHFALVVLLAALGVTGCRPKPPVVAPKAPDGTVLESPDPPDPEQEQAALALEKEAEAEQNPAEAQKKRDLLIALYPSTAAGARELLVRARAAETDGDTGRAVKLYETLLFHRPTIDGANTIREAYANLLLHAERFDDAVNVLRFLFNSAEEAKDQQRIGVGLARALDGAGKSKEAAETYVDLHGVAGISDKLRREIEERVFQLVTSSLGFQEAQTLWESVESKSSWEFVLPALAYKLAKIYYHTRNYDRSEKMLRLVSTRFSSSTYGPLARDFLTRLRARFKVEPLSVGVLLPLSGSYQQYGTRSLAAIQLALGKSSGINLIVKDTAGDPTVAAKAVEALVLDNNVIAIIGPLFSNESLSASLKAEELSVPIIALSHRQGLPEIGSWVFRTALTVEAQAKALAEVSFEDLGYTRFAMLYPRSRYGTEFVNAFWAEVDGRKGEIRAAESYEPSQTNFSEPIRKLVGRYYTNSRWDYRDQLAKLRQQNLPSHIFQRKLEEIMADLPPIVDFDAIVIPDSGRNIGLIAPAVKVQDIILTRDPRMLERIRKAMGRKNVEPITLLGASTWNTQATVENCEKDCESSIFVDAYYPDSTDIKVRDFVSTFTETTGAAPNLTEAQSFDTAAMLKWVMSSKKPTDRSQLRASLLKMGSFEGVTGRMSFNDVGEVQKKLITLTIVDGAIRQWEKPEAKPEG
ncbi:MAG: hypothetical protein A2289_09745 [Deltaproteobacteria bacterium RIFOXYA12_FULL_58_15]|nr:MAG: hypothetical protein A2289_09745 [Deltaproteobacteria bacterium RIFOXYA12_FULL_58_15]